MEKTSSFQPPHLQNLPDPEAPMRPLVDMVADHLSEANMELMLLTQTLETKVNRVIPVDVHIPVPVQASDSRVNPAPDCVSNTIGEQFEGLRRTIGRLRVAMNNLEMII